MRPRQGLLATAVAVAIAGCGSSGSSRLQQSPQALISAAQKAIRSAHGYTATAELRQAGRPQSLSVTADAHGSLDVSIAASGLSFRLITVPTGAYINADAQFWTSSLGPRAVRFAGRWVVLPRSHAALLTRDVASFTPAYIARCLGEDHGSLSVRGTTTVAGRRGVVVHDSGGAPGSAPGDLAVALSGPAYPLSLSATGPQRAGGRVDVCNTGRGSGAQGTITFSHFGQVPTITAPKGAIVPTASGLSA